MNEILLLSLALLGAAALGYLFCWTLLRQKLLADKSVADRLRLDLAQHKASCERLQTENETHRLSLDNLQKLLQEMENQSFAMELERKSLRSENAKQKAELDHLLAQPREKIKEIEVIREVPVLVFRDPSLHDNRLEKAKKLLNAFRKGYTLDEKPKTTEVLPPIENRRAE